ncbi:MAG: hypothetical protein WCO45_18245 [Pseudanabaena sp. ELA607]|jgi:hypothetical protein
MTASRVPVPDPRRNPKLSRRHSRSKSAPKGAATGRNKSKVSALPRHRQIPFPLWLKALMAAQNLSIAATILLTASVFGIYGWTVYAQDQWNQQYKKLEHLKRQERQLTTAEEALDNNLIRSVQQQPGDLVRERPEQSIFLPAAPLRPKRDTPPTNTTEAMRPATESERIGY